MQRSRRPQRARHSFDRNRSGLTCEQLEARLLLAHDLKAHEFVPGEILVQYSAQTTPAQRLQAQAAVVGEVKEVIQTRTMQAAGMGRLERIALGPGIEMAQAIQLMQQKPGVLFAEPNYIYRAAVVSNDTYYTNGSLWGMYSDDSPNAGPANTTNQFGSQAEKAWNQNITGSSNVVVGVIDEGFQVTHPDLDANAWVNPFEIPGDGIDNDGNGYRDDVYGWDFVNNDNSVYDGTSDDHGTHCAGTIGAEGGNGAGVVGVNWNIKMISAKFLGTSGGTTANAVKSVDYLTDLKTRHGINLVASSNSWGGGGYSQALHDAIIRHAKQNILFVAAAGNSTSNNDAVASYPSNYNTTVGTSSQTAASYDGVIAVASITNTGAISSFSSYGATTVDIGAPGSGIWSTLPSNTYGSYSGTSMATPHVTGAVALYASNQTGPLTAKAIKDAILNSATPTASLAGKTLTGGRLNVFAALTQGPDQTPPVISGLSVLPGSSTARISWTTNEAATTEVLYGTSPTNLNLTFNDPALLFNHTAVVSGLAPQTTYYFQARTRDSAGNTTTSATQSFTTYASASILFVDDDFGQNFDSFYATALQAGGYVFDTWNVVYRGQTPSAAALNSYGLVIWNTGVEFNAVGSGLAAGEQSAIASYLDAGGRIFISGHDVLFNTVGATFQQNYLKVASYTNDVRTAAHTATGVAGHPIGNGLSLPIASPAGFGTLYVDAVTPVAGAEGWLNHGVSSTSPFSAVSYRGDYAAGGFGMVFTTTPFEAISTSAANPNNQNSVMKRVIEFLRPSGPPPGFVVGAPAPSANTTEAGGAVSFTVVLTAQPSANVTIPVSSSDTTEGTVNVSSLVFTSANWNVPQTVTVTGANDNLDDNDIAYSIILGAVSSADSTYNGLNPSDVALTNLDDDTAGITRGSPSGSSTTEAGGTVTFTVRLNSEPTADVTLPVSSSDTTEGTVSVASLVFTAANWNVPQTVTVTGVNDSVDDGDIAYSILIGAATSSDTLYNGQDPADVALSNLDDDTAGITRGTPSGSTTSEAGGTVTFTVRLNSEPTANVTIPVSSSDTTEGVVSVSSLVFTPANWNVNQTVTVTGVNDSLTDGDISYTVILGAASSTDTMYNGQDPADIALTNLDDDAPGVIRGTPSGSTTTETGGTVSFTVRLNSQPTANVTIPISSSDTTEGTVNVSSLVFTSANWNVNQTVIVTGVNDNLDDNNIAYTIILGAASSTDPAYNGLNPSDVALTNIDDDTAGVTVGAPSGTSTTEAGGAITFTVRLNSEPTANVTFGISSSDTTEGTVSVSSLVFTSANWNVNQTVTVTGVDDAIVDGNIAYTVVIAAATSADSLYNGINPNDVALTNIDNDSSGSSTKFYVVDDATQNRTFEYDANGGSVENYLVNSGNTTPRGVATTAAGDKIWVVDANRNVYIYNNSGGLLGSWAAGTLSTSANVQGIATDGTHVWIVDAQADRVFYYANAASRLSGTQSAVSFALNLNNRSASDLVVGSDSTGQYLYILDSSTTDRVYRYAFNATRGPEYRNAWVLNSVNSSPTGITLDPSNGSFDIWVVDSGTDRVYRYANARNLTAPALTSSFALASGNANPQGIADPPPAGAPGEVLEPAVAFNPAAFMQGGAPAVVGSRSAERAPQAGPAALASATVDQLRLVALRELSADPVDQELSGSRSHAKQGQRGTSLFRSPAELDLAFAKWN